MPDSGIRGSELLGALGSTVTFFFTTLTIIPFIPGGWDPAAGFPAMAGAVPFLIKDVVLLAVSFYLLKQGPHTDHDAEQGYREGSDRTRTPPGKSALAI